MAEGSNRMAKPDGDPSGQLAGTTVAAQRIIVRDLILPCTIGVSDAERATAQRLLFNLVLEVTPEPPRDDDFTQVFNYARIVKLLRELSRETQFKLLETLAETIAADCFDHDRVIETRIRIEKLERYDEVDGIGIEIVRHRT